MQARRQLVPDPREPPAVRVPAFERFPSDLAQYRNYNPHQPSCLVELFVAGKLRVPGVKWRALTLAATRSSPPLPGDESEAMVREKQVWFHYIARLAFKAQRAVADGRFDEVPQYTLPADAADVTPQQRAADSLWALFVASFVGRNTHCRLRVSLTTGALSFEASDDQVLYDTDALGLTYTIFDTSDIAVAGALAGPLPGARAPGAPPWPLITKGPLGAYLVRLRQASSGGVDNETGRALLRPLLRYGVSLLHYIAATVGAEFDPSAPASLLSLDFFGTPALFTRGGALVLFDLRTRQFETRVPDYANDIVGLIEVWRFNDNLEQARAAFLSRDGARDPLERRIIFDSTQPMERVEPATPEASADVEALTGGVNGLADDDGEVRDPIADANVGWAMDRRRRRFDDE